MTWTAYLPGRTVTDPRSDIKSGTRIEQYKISDQAVYFPREKYLLLSDIRRTWIQEMIRLICEKNPSVVVEQWSRQAQLDGTAPK